MTYSLDFRLRVLKIKQKEGLSYVSTSKRFGIAINSILRWTRRVEAKISRNKPSTKINIIALKVDIQKYPDAYYYERAQRLKVSNSGIRSAMQKLHITYKKNSQSSKGLRKRSAHFQSKDQRVQTS